MNQEDYFVRYEAESYFSRTTSTFNPEDFVENLSLRKNKTSIYEFLTHSLDLSGMRVLEVGCAVGDLLYLLRRQHSCQVVGVEPSVSAATIASTVLDLEVEACAFSQSKVFGLDKGLRGAFDLIILDDVVGWMDPTTILPTIGVIDHLLSDSGYLFIRELYSPFSFRVPNHHHPNGKLYNHRYGEGLQKYFCFGGHYVPLKELTRQEDGFQSIETNSRFSVWRDSLLAKTNQSLFPVVEVTK